MHRIAVINGGPLPPEIKPLFSDLEYYESVSSELAAELARNICTPDRCDAIICVTGLSAFIRPAASVPVFVRDPSGYDIIDTLRKASQLCETGETTIAMILHENWKIEVERYQPYCEHRILLRHYRTSAEIASIVAELAHSGVRTFVGGPNVCSSATLFGLHSVFLPTGASSLRNEIEQVEAFLEYQDSTSLQRQRLDAVIDDFEDAIFITDRSGRILRSNKAAQSLFGKTSEELSRETDRSLLGKQPALAEILKKHGECSHRLVSLNGANCFVTIRSTGLRGELRGQVFTIASANRIEQMEHSYRRDRTRGLTAKHTFDEIKTVDPAMITVKEIARAYSQTDSTVLIYGETGTGKELFAHSIHLASPRHSGPFVAVNCAALPEHLLESELFGYAEGAFTGARRGGKAGLFELAHGGTIFLDEISQVPIQLQGAILRVLQEKQVLRVGGTGIIPIDVRVIAASNENLRELVREGRMRQDLYYRLNILKVHVPPLRERSADIPLLLETYYGQLLSEYPNASPLSREAVTILSQYSWPGNIRELVNFVERCMIAQSVLGKEERQILYDYFRDESDEMLISLGADPERTAPAAERAQISPGPVKDAPGDDTVPVCPDTLERMEQQIIRLVLEKTGGNHRKAAAILSISRPTLLKRLEKPLDAPASENVEPVWLRVAPLDQMTRQVIEAILAQKLGSRRQTAEFLGVSRSTLWKHLQGEGS